MSRDQLRVYGVDRHYVRTQLKAGRWQQVSHTVLATTTGPLSQEQQLWVGVLQADQPAALAGLTALALAGLQGWHRPSITVLVPKSEDPVRLDGYLVAETRRDIPALTAPTAPPRLRVEPAALLFAAYDRSERSGLRLGRLCRQHGLKLPDRQVPRRDRNGRRRWLDAEWILPDGRVVVLEIDGAFHMDVDDWWADMGRERELVIHRRQVLRCSSFELRRLPGRIAGDLRAIGVPDARPDERGA